MNSTTNTRPVAAWLYLGVFMILVQVLLGGITRLTGSGLSITEWKPLLGAIPPVSEQDWNLAFKKYQQIAQFKYINNHFTLSDFKYIYFWEWLHRNWARLMGIVFIIPFIYFILKKKIDRRLIASFILLFILAALQGLIGWIMVQSGLNSENTSVSHLRLAIHFIAALILLCYVLWLAFRFSISDEGTSYSPFLRRLNLVLLVLLTIQLTYGAFMAGSHAALAARTWPDINGTWWPAGMFKQNGFLTDIAHNLYTIQFIHRNLAYLITILILVWYLRAAHLPADNKLKKVRFYPLVLVLLQVALGVFTLLNSEFRVPLAYGAAHQLTGILLLMSLLFTLFLNRKKAS
ncbi:COX15/CtaA family protein [Rubrolithibacter danxiaensis]|uniref:COX15/CtaA family protein n=1 Tax=Rubrolithibacter danxiaensis TaxID=3390805 RepID=UPI003BF83EC7